MGWLEFYRTVTTPIGLVVIPVIRFFEKRSSDPSAWRQRRGLLPETVLKQAPFDLWIHGASVGEMTAVKAIVDQIMKMRPSTKVLVSSFTPAGVLQARKIFAHNIPTIHLPIDYPKATRLVSSALSPKVFCTVETELWPNLLLSLRETGSRLLLLNGRISGRSFNSYKRIRFLLKELLGSFDFICTITNADRERLICLGAKTKRLKICGNAKYEDMLIKADPQKAKAVGQKLGLAQIDRPVIVAGSIRANEYRDVYQASIRLRRDGLEPFIVLVPRHLERTKQIKAYLEAKGETFQLSSQVLSSRLPTIAYKNCSFLIIDQIGLLFWLYHYCHVAFVGGSIAPLGGQNIMEPAAWGKPVIFGPFVDNFQEAADLLIQQGGGRMVRNSDDLYLELKRILVNQNLRKGAGKMAKKTLEMLGKGAASIQAQKILEFLCE